MAIPQYWYLAKGAKRPSHTTNMLIPTKYNQRKLFAGMEFFRRIEYIQCVERIPYQRLISFGYILWRLAYLLYGSVASLPSPSINIEVLAFHLKL